VAAVLVQELLHPPGDLPLAATDERLACQRLERAVGGLAGAADQLDLALVLDRAQPLDEAVRGPELDAAVAQPLPGGVGERAGLEAELTLDEAGRSPITSRFTCRTSTPSTMRARST